MKCIVTVVGKDRIGIIAGVSGLLSSLSINILDISQTIMGDMFTMIMATDTAACTESFDTLSAHLSEYGDDNALSIRIQRDDIFNAMHRV